MTLEPYPTRKWAGGSTMYIHREIEEVKYKYPAQFEVKSRLEQGVLYKSDRTVGKICALVTRSVRCNQDSDRAIACHKQSNI